MASGFVAESIEVDVVALARMLLGEGAQHHQSLFTSRIAVPIVVVQVVARRSNKNAPLASKRETAQNIKAASAGHRRWRPNLRVFSQSWLKQSVESVDGVHYL